MPKRRGFSELRRPDWSFKGRMPKFGSTMSRGSLALCVMHHSPSRWPNWNSGGTCLGFLAFMPPRRMARSPKSAVLDALIGSRWPSSSRRTRSETSRHRSRSRLGRSQSASGLSLRTVNVPSYPPHRTAPRHPLRHGARGPIYLNCCLWERLSLSGCE
jgi:hypothetical protein